jgi:hypothetical protein
MATVTVGQARQTLAAVEGTLQNPDILKGKVEDAFHKLDDDNSGYLETAEARQLVTDLCQMMHLPVPTTEEFDAHLKALDADKDGRLNCNEVGSGVVGALQYKANSYKHYLAFAERDKLADDAPLPHA